jgi:hypothetical protein
VALTDQYALANDAAFQQRVRVAVMTAAVNVMTEEPGSHPVVNDKRAVYATKVVSDGCSSELVPYCYAVVTNAVIVSGSSDSDIQFQVNAVFNAMAGVTGQDLLS